MRVNRSVLAAAVLAAAPAFAQVPAGTAEPYGLDPYSPSDTALVRKYAGVLVAQTPVLEFRKLDTYKPSHAAWLRQDGGLPVWGTYWYPTPMPYATDAGARMVMVTAQVAPGEPTAQPAAPAAPAASPTAGPTAVSSVPRPTTGDGIYIVYQQQRWLRAGPSLPADDSFVRAGDYGEVGAFRRQGGPTDVIYVPARKGGPMVPYRLKP
jgi:hypothetical protein